MLPIAVITGLGMSAVGTEWQFRSFNLTLDNFNPKEGLNPRSGELDLSFQEKPTGTMFICNNRWEAKYKPPAWRGCYPQLYFRAQNISTSIPMEISLDLVYMEEKKHPYPSSSAEGFTMHLAKVKIGANSTGTRNNWLACNLHRHDKDLACNLIDSPGPLTVVPQTSVHAIESFQIRNMTVRGLTENTNNCSVKMSIYNPGAEFILPNSESPAEEQRLRRIGPVSSCELSWDCRKIVPGPEEKGVRLRCNNNFTSVIYYKQDKELRFEYVRPSLSVFTRTGFGQMFSEGAMLIPMKPGSVGLGGSCNNAECTWKTVAVSRRVSFTPYGYYD